MARLLAMVPWIAARDGPTVEEVCERFAISEAELAADLEVVWFVGVHPFSPAELIEVTFEDGRVWIRYADWFARPLRLTPAQALTLVAAGSSLLAVPGSDPDGPLAGGLGKLARVLGIEPGADIEVDLGAVDERVYACLEEAISSRRAVRIDYYGYNRDERAERVVEPQRLSSHGGNWYVAAHCRRSGGDRVFRLDRIHDLELLDEPVTTAAEEPDGLAVFAPAASDPRVVLELEPSARWVTEEYPHEGVEEVDAGRCRVRLAVSARPWLERLLLRLGPEARVISGAPPGLAAEAAQRILARYPEAAPSR